MNWNNRVFVAAQIAYVAVIIAASALMPGADIVSTATAMVGVWVLTSIVYRRFGACNNAGWWTLLAATSILSVGVIANVHYFTTVLGGTTAEPVLCNADAHRYYYDALEWYGSPDGIPTRLSHRGYGLLISGLWHITGVTIVSPLILNMTLTLLCIIMSGIICRKLICGNTSHDAGQISTCAMIMTASVCYYLNSGTLLLKEAPLGFSLTLCFIGISQLMYPVSDKRTQVNLWICFNIGLLFVTLLRFTFSFYILAAIVIFSFKNKDNLRVKMIMMLTCIAVCVTAKSILGSQYETSNIITGNTLSSSFFYDEPQHQAHNELFNGYFDFPWWKKLLLTPVSAGVQFLIPFPWGFDLYKDFGYTLAYARIGFPWYIIGGMIIYYIFFSLKKSPAPLRYTIIWAALMWLIPAYLFAGTVSRYTLPLIPMLIPAAVYTFAEYRNRRSFHIYSIVFITLLAIALATGFYIQQKAIA